MINILNGSKNLVIVIHEIYGINQHMKEVCRSLAEKNFDVMCPNLLNRQEPFEYSQDEAAYRNFMENIGFADASAEVKKLLLDVKDQYEKIYIVGFSAGATIAWLCSEMDCLSGVAGYYGSGIRGYLEKNPSCPVMLFFPEEEKSFNVAELIDHLKDKNVELHQFSGEHGFSDPYSPKYHAESREEAHSRLIEFLSI